MTPSEILQPLLTNLQANRQRVSHGLNLVLELRQSADMPELLLRIQAAQPKIRLALSELHFVHFARFLPTRDGTALQVITEFDGPLEPYVMDFAIMLSDEFSMMLSFVKDAPPLPVKRHPDAFWKFVELNNRVHVVGLPLPADLDYPLYSAYPEATVLDIVGPRTQLPPPVQDRPSAAVDHADVQGNILRGYRAFQARHFVLEVRQRVPARAWFAALASGPQGGVPAITNNETWAAKPATVLNVGFTFAGLKALGVPADDLERFPEAFRQGPAQAARAAANGDVGDSQPAGWRLGAPNEPAHAMLSLHAFEGREADFDAAAAAIVAALPAAGLRLLSSHDTRALGSDPAVRNKIYFGYEDGVSEPRTDVCQPPRDLQPAASPGEFLLHPDYQDIFGGPSIGTLPPLLARNGSFCAVRLLEQHVDRFETLLKDGAAQLGVSESLVAAKLMGRWQDGTPLALFPDDASKAQATPADRQRNDFDYAPSYEYPTVPQDHHGQRCPVGAHIRRTNPRSARHAGARHSRRLIRRGMPYSVPAGRGRPAERGLFGLFFCGSLERQFEFVQQQWINGDLFASGLRGTQDPIAGAQTGGATLALPGMGPGGTTAQLSLPRLTTTRGGLYLLVPGLSALRSLTDGLGAPVLEPIGSGLDDAMSQLSRRIERVLTPDKLQQLSAALFAPLPTARGEVIAGARGASGFDPNAFDPLDRGFIARPYPTFAAFRREFPVWWVPQHDAYWVFTHAAARDMCVRVEHFLKQPPGDKSPRGLFSMEIRRHREVRPLLDQAFKTARANARRQTEEATRKALNDVDGACFDLVGAFARRVPAEVLFEVMGIPVDERSRIDRLARTVMLHADRTLDPLQRLLGQLAGVELAARLGGMLAAALLPSRKGTLLHEIAWLVLKPGKVRLQAVEAVMTLLQFVIAGYMSVEFLLSTGIRQLLLNDAADWKTLQGRPAGLDPLADQPLLDAIDEMRRCESPLGLMDRFAGHDDSVADRRGVTLGGVFIPEGARVVGLLGSANRDADVFGADAERFDVGRPPDARALALGHGERTCIGLPLQRLVAPIALAMLMAHRPDLRLIAPHAEPPWLGDPYFRSFERLIVGEH